MKTFLICLSILLAGVMGAAVPPFERQLFTTNANPANAVNANQLSVIGGKVSIASGAVVTNLSLRGSLTANSVTVNGLMTFDAGVLDLDTLDGVLLRTDATGKPAETSIGSGLTFDGTTLSATGAGGGNVSFSNFNTNQFASNSTIISIKSVAGLTNVNLYGGGTGSGEFQFGTTVIDSSAGIYLQGGAQIDMDPDANITAFIVDGSLTGSSGVPIVDLGSVWNTSGLANAFNIDITDTASDPLSTLANWRIGGVSKFSVTKGGLVTAVTITATGMASNTAPVNTVGQLANGSFVQIANGSGNGFPLTADADFNQFSGTNIYSLHGTGGTGGGNKTYGIFFQRSGYGGYTNFLEANAIQSAIRTIGFQVFNGGIVVGNSNDVMSPYPSQFLGINIGGATNAGLIQKLNGLTVFTVTSNGAVHIRSPDNLDYMLRINTNQLVVTNGLVGIGTASPVVALQVNGLASVGTSLAGLANVTLNVDANANTRAILLTDSTTGRAATDGTYIGMVGVDFYLQNQEATGKSIFGSGGLETLTLDASQRVGIGTTTPTNTLSVNGTTMLQSNVFMSTNSMLVVATGPKQRAGNATLVGGTVTVANTSVTANTLVLLTRKTAGGTLGFALTYSVIAGTSFTITATDTAGVLSALDTSTISYFLIENN